MVASKIVDHEAHASCLLKKTADWNELLLCRKKIKTRLFFATLHARTVDYLEYVASPIVSFPRLGWLYLRECWTSHNTLCKYF